MTLSYTMYGDVLGAELTHEELLGQAKAGDLLAHAEFSGCEGCYIEVARWSHIRNRWERYCFEKVFGGEHPSEADEASVKSHVTAEKFAREINDASNCREVVIHNMPNWEGE